MDDDPARLGVAVLSNVAPFQRHDGGAQAILGYVWTSYNRGVYDLSLSKHSRLNERLGTYR